MKNNCSPFHLCCCAVFFVVLLRVAIGWHFLYEGVHKFDPADKFSAEGFLGIAKGTTAELYYWMLPDIDGTQRLVMGTVKDENDEKGEKVLDTFIVYENAWRAYFKEYLMTYLPPSKSEADAEAFINMGTKDFVDWVKKNVPESVKEKIVDMNAAQLTAWATQYVPPVDTPDIFVDLFTMKGKTKGKTPTQIEAEQRRLTAELKVWAEHNLLLATAKTLGGMDAAQQEDWAKQNLPLTDKSKRDEVVKAKTLVETKMIYNRYIASLREEAKEAKNDVEAFLASRDRFQEHKKTFRNDTMFEQERRWNQLFKYRFEAAAWTRMFNDLGDALQSDLGRLVDPELAGQKGQFVTAPEKELFPENFLGITYQIPPEISNLQCPVTNLRIRGRMDAMNLAVMFGLSAIGLCMIFGFCNRLACLGGAAFLMNVVLTTYPVPGVYPPIPPMIGNYMFVSKDVVELIALLFLASIPAGRWGGLDYFLWHFGGKQIARVIICPFCRCSTENKTENKA